jgi:CHAT domain-containing protein/tetratricopeptide (TPR) repeat protein
VAYLAVAERTQELMPMLRALDAVDAALARDSTSSAARFNRALILGRLFLVRSAGPAWSAYIASERDERWKAEAREHLKALKQSQDSLAPRFFAQRARERFFALLGTWGTAISRGDRTHADSLFNQAIALRDSLGSDAADQSVAMTVEWLRMQTANPAAYARIALAFVDLANGIALHDNLACDIAGQPLSRADEALKNLKAPAARWAAFYRAACEANQRKFEAADTRLERTLRQTIDREPALVGKILWVRGVIQMRQGNYETAIDLYEKARLLFARASEVPNEAAIAFLLTESLGFAGQWPASEAEAYRALRGLGPFRSTRYLSFLLIKAAAHARRERLSLAALDILSEALIVDRTLKDYTGTAYARWTRAENLAVVGDTVGALVELDSATASAMLVPDTTTGAAAVAQAELVRGRLLQHRAPARSRFSLDRAVDAYRTLGAVNVLPDALFQSAVLAERTGDTRRARSELAEAISVIERRRASFSSAEAQAAYYETVENVFDVAIKLELEDGRTDSAFELLERERVAIRPETDAQVSAATTSLASVAGVVPHDMLFVAYAVLADRVAIWYAHERTRGYLESAVSRDTIAAIAARAVREIRESGTLEARARMFDILLRPLATQLRSAHTVAVVPDRELVAVPFAALWDSATKHYAIQEVAFLTEPSASFMVAASRATRPGRVGMSALIVGNPSKPTSSDTSLAELPGAAAEAARVAELYPEPLVLTGHAANRRSVIEALSHRAVFHFAGHAVFDPIRPERSYLALSDSGEGTGRLEAREIARLNLSITEIVVLSACRSLPAKSSRSGTVAGVAFSFLRAGAPAIVSTLWDITDDGAADVVVAFHQGLRDGVEPSEALRRAQVAALQATDRRRSAAGTWAAFVYTGPWTLNTRSD